MLDMPSRNPCAKVCQRLRPLLYAAGIRGRIAIGAEESHVRQEANQPRSSAPGRSLPARNRSSRGPAAYYAAVPESQASQSVRTPGLSQGGEDGIIAEIFRRIGVTTRTFTECAPGDGLECNTLYLLTQGSSGVWVEANAKHLRAIRQAFKKKLSENSLRLQSQRVTAENVDAVLDQAPLPVDFDLLSIDLDRNDYWVWSKIDRYRPRVVVIE